MDRIETEHLVLRKARPDDLNAIWKNVWSDHGLTRYMLWKPTDTYEDAVSRLERTFAYQSSNHAWFVCLKETDEPIGFAGLRVRADGSCEESGVCIAKKYQRMGYGRETANALIQLSFDEFGADRFYWSCRTENAPSRNLIQSLGGRYVMTEERTRDYDGAEYTIDTYAIDK